MTLNKFYQLFKTIADDHQMINDYGFGPSYNIGDVRPMLYPFLWVEPINTTVITGEPGTGYLTQTYQFKLYVLDKVDKGDDNFRQTSNDCDYILKTILSVLDQEYLFIEMGLRLQDDVSAEPVYEQLEDNSNGWETTLTLRMPMDYTPCNSPVEAFVPPPPPAGRFVASSIYDYVWISVDGTEWVTTNVGNTGFNLNLVYLPGRERIIACNSTSGQNTYSDYPYENWISMSIEDPLQRETYYSIEQDRLISFLYNETGTGNMIYSDNGGDEWTPATFSTDMDGGFPLNAVWCASQSQWLSTYQSLVSFSPDGINWDHPLDYPDVNLGSVDQTRLGLYWIADLGLYFLLRDQTDIVTSPDGINWTTVYTSQWSIEGGQETFRSLAWNGINLTVVMDDSFIIYSEDGGTTWLNSTPNGYEGTGDLLSVAWSPILNLFVAIQYSPDMPFLSSPDGKSWSVTSDPTVDYFSSIVWTNDPV